MDSRPVWGPTVRGPIVRFLEVDNWAPDSWARGPTVRGPVVRFLEVDNWAPDSWAPGPTVRGPTVRGPTVRGPIHRGPICLEPQGHLAGKDQARTKEKPIYSQEECKTQTGIPEEEIWHGIQSDAC